MRIKNVVRYLGLVLTFLGLFMMLPLAWSLFRGEPCAAAFAIAYFISIILGLSLWRLIRAPQGTLSHREAILLVAVSWIMVSFFGALPYAIAGTFNNFMDAWFESVSGFTTTGATALTTIGNQPQGILLWRGLTQWLGGMGIITLFVALFPILGIGATHLVDSEMPGPQTEKLTPRIRDTAKSVWIIYIGLSVLEFILLLIGRMPAFDAFAVTMGTMPTGGFAPIDFSIEAYNSLYIEIVIIVFMVLAGVNFGLFYLLVWKRQVKQLLANPEFRFYIIFIVGASILIMLNLMADMDLSFGSSLRHSIFQTISIMTTTGFNSTDFNLWPPLAKTVLLILMLIGASAGSTGGALKVVRILVLFKYAYRCIVHAFNPRAVMHIKMDKTVLSEDVVSSIIGMSTVYIGITIFAFIVMSATGLDVVSSLSSVLASIGNVGPGLNLVGPVANYAFIHPLGKFVLTLCMLIGRLEVFTILLLFVPSFWKWR